MTSVFGGPQTVPTSQTTNQSINQASASQQAAASAMQQASTQQMQTGPQAQLIGGGLANWANTIATQPQAPPIMNVAPLTLAQQNSINGLMASGMGMQPLINQGQGYIGQGVGVMGQGTGLMNQAGQGITAQDINSFYNPMAGNVTAQLQNIFGQQNLASRLGATAGAGGIGGDRAAVAQGILANQQGLAAGQIYSQLYQNALQAAEQQKAQQLGAGQGLVGAGGQLSNLAFPTMQAGFGGMETALGAGTVQQQAQQAQYNAQYQNALMNYQDPFLRMQALSGAIGPLNQAFGVGQTTTGQQAGLTGAQQMAAATGTQAGTGFGATTYPAPAILPQVAGLGALGLGAMGLFSGSDRSLKTDIQKIGKHPSTGLPIYAYRYKGDPKSYPKTVGPMAQDVKKAYPGAVANIGGKLAIKKFQSGGAVFPSLATSNLNPQLPTASDWQSRIQPALQQGMNFQPLLSGFTGGTINLGGLGGLLSNFGGGGGGGVGTGTGTGGSQFMWGPGQPVSQSMQNQLAAQPASFWSNADPQNIGMGRIYGPSGVSGGGGSFGLKRGGRIQGYQDAGPVVSDTDSDSDSEPDSDTDDTDSSTTSVTGNLGKYAKGMNLLNQYAKSATPKTPQATPIRMPSFQLTVPTSPTIQPPAPMAMAASGYQSGGSTDTDDSASSSTGSKTVPSADPDVASLRFETMANLAQGREVPPFQKGFEKGGVVKGYADAGPVDDSEDDGEHESAGLPEDSGDDSEDTADTVTTPLPRPRPQEAGFGQGRGMLLPPMAGRRMLPGPGGGMGGLGGMAQSPYMALMQAGLGMLAASGQRDARGLPMSPLGAVGAGGMAGMNTLQQQQAFALKQRALDESVALRREQLNALEQHRQALENTARERLAIARGETGKPITLQTPYGPKSVIRQPDGTLVDAYSGRPVGGQQTAIPSAAAPTAGEGSPFDSGPIAPPETDDQKAIAAGLMGRHENEPLFKTPQRSTPEFQDMLESMQTSPQQFDFMAARYALGDTTILQGTRGRAGAAIFANALKARAQDYWMDKGLSPKEANMAMVELQAKKAGARAIENQTGRITGALGRAAETAKVVTALSDKVNRSQYPDLNRIILDAKRRIGDEDTIRYGLSMETFIKNYAAATGQGSSVFTDHQYKTMANRLNEAWSKGQVRAVIDQGLIEINRELKGSHNALDMYLGKGAEPEGLEETAPPASKAAPAEGQKRQFKEGPATFRGGKWILDEQT